MADNNLLLEEALQQIDIDLVLTDEQEESLKESEHEARREKRRQQRMQDCGNWSYWYNPHTGKQTSFTFKCGLFRDCRACLERRADTEYEWVRDTVKDKSLKVLRVSSKEATNLLRRKDKTEYVRYPQEDGIDLLIVSGEAGIEGKEIDYEWVCTQDWTEIVCTPKGRNKSGSVHVPPSDDLEDFSLITTRQFTTDANRQQVVDAMQEAEEETSELDPKNPSEVLKALNVRFNTATNKLKADGYKVQVYDKRLRLIHSRIDWQSNSVHGGIKKGFNTKIKTTFPLSSGQIGLKQALELVSAPSG